jgi:large subunit ribosomal protein L25
MFAIKAKKREAGVDVDALRKRGEIPAVFYGAKNPSTSIVISAIEFKKIWLKAGESSTVSVTTEDGKAVDVLIHDVQVDPVTDEPIHVDFLVIDMSKKIKVHVELVFEGVSEAVKSGLGNLVKVLHEVEIEALPKDLPHSLTVDISKLVTVQDQVFISDIKLPPGVEIVTKSHNVVCSIALQVEEKEEVAAPVDLSAIEVEKKGKKEEEGAPGAEPDAVAPEKK